jgi:hypothetical protein
MANLTQTAATVKASSKATKKDGIAGATIVAGNVLYLDEADNKLKLADANGVASGRIVAGIALNGSSDGQPVKYATSDPALVLGATLVVGQDYMLSDTPGAIAPVSDAVSGDYVTVLGVAISVTELNFAPVAAGAPKA